MPESELRPKPVDLESQEFSLESLLDSDGEVNSIEPSLFSRNIVEKKKGRPNLQTSLEQIYSHPTENSQQLLDGLHEAADQFVEVNGELRQAKKDYLGCKTLLDTVYYGPAIADMLYRIATQNISWTTIPEAAALSAASSILLFIINAGIDQPDKKSGKVEHTWDMYAEDKEQVRELAEKLEHQVKVINAHIKFLGLSETVQGLKREYQYPYIVDQISEFFDDKEIEEEILRQTSLKPQDKRL